jgi:hypothetical protein
LGLNTKVNAKLVDLVKGLIGIALAVALLYALGAAHDATRTESGWSFELYHGRLGYLLLFGGWLAVLGFLVERLIKWRSSPSKS